MIYILPTDTCFGMACEFTDTKAYSMIYKIKKRDWNKPLAMMVQNFEWLQKYTPLSTAQINYLKSYTKPFTILTECSYIKQVLQLSEGNIQYPNKEVYNKIAFRVAHNKPQKELIKKIGPLFLTSANISDEPEIFQRDQVEKTFHDFIEKGIMTLLSNTSSEAKNPASDILIFEGETTNVTYIRKT